MALVPRDVLGASPRGLASNLPIVENFLHTGGHPLFPGLVGLVGATLGLIVVLRRRRDDFRADRLQELLLIALAGAILVVLAFGDWQTIAGHRIWLPYALMRHVPAFSELRAVSRLALGAQLAVALFAAVGLGALLRRLSSPWTSLAFVALAAIVCAEGISGIPLTTVPTAGDNYGIDRVLGRHPTGVVLELPMQSGAKSAPIWAYVEMPRQLEAVRDGFPRLNGYSGFQPDRFDNLAIVMNQFPAPGAVKKAREVGVRYVVLRTKIVGGAPPSVRFVLRKGAGSYSDDAARQMIRDLPSGSARVIGHTEGGYVLELTEWRRN
jgi:hypothetical protein